jgi:hypothetical protein
MFSLCMTQDTQNYAIIQFRVLKAPNYILVSRRVENVDKYSSSLWRS